MRLRFGQTDVIQHMMIQVFQLVTGSQIVIPCRYDASKTDGQNCDQRQPGAGSQLHQSVCVRHVCHGFILNIVSVQFAFTLASY